MEKFFKLIYKKQENIVTLERCQGWVNKDKQLAFNDNGSGSSRFVCTDLLTGGLIATGETKAECMANAKDKWDQVLWLRKSSKVYEGRENAFRFMKSLVKKGNGNVALSMDDYEAYLK